MHLSLKALVLISFSLMASSLSALKLPDGTEAEVSEIEKKQDKIVLASLLKPALFKTPAGKLTLKGDVAFYLSGSIKEGVLNTPETLSTPAGKLKISAVGFYESGKLAFADFPASSPLNTPWGRVLADSVGFYESGKIKSIHLAGPHELESASRKMIFAQDLFFYENGKVKEGFLPIDQKIRYEKRFLKAAQGKIFFHENGAVSQIGFSETEDFSTPVKTFKARFASFSQEGRLTGLILAEPEKFQTPQGEFEAEDVRIDARGALRYALFTRPETLKTPAGTLSVRGAGFYPDGGLKFCLLAEEAVLEGQTYLEGQVAVFSPEGKVLGAGEWFSGVEEFLPALWPESFLMRFLIP